MNFLDKTNIKKKIVLRQLSKEQLKEVVAKLEEFLESENADEFKKIFGIEIGVNGMKKEVKEEIEEIKVHLNTLKNKVETMYDNTTEKISEVFETKIRYRALYFGIALAFIVNADFFGIYHSLSKSPAIRAQLIAQSDNISTKMDDLANQIEQIDGKGIESKEDVKGEITKIKATLDNINNTGLELGWTTEEYDMIFHNKDPEKAWSAAVSKFIGLLIAGLLISFGAPFWHDFVGTFTGLRKTLRGKKEGKGENNTSLPANPLVR